jgi:F0F1-type ATP synthase assembly protein I
VTAFSYAFGMAMSLALAIAIGNAWAREHRQGVWTMRMAVMLVVAGLAVGIVLGWALDQYFKFIAASASGR